MVPQKKKEKADKQIKAERIKNLLKQKVVDGRYKLYSNFESGAFGSIFYAEKEGRPYAIKALDLDFTHQSWNEEQVEKYKKYCTNESVAMRICKSQYVLKCHESMIVREGDLNIMLIVTDYCRCGDLYGYLNNVYFLSQRDAKKILKQVIFGLAELHQNKIVHRDLKTSNILLNRNAKIADLGLSKQLEWGWKEKVTKQGTNIGTKYVRSPQMIMNKPYGYVSDLWSIGILFYQMLTGVFPFWAYEKILKEPEEILLFYEKQIKNLFQKSYIQDRFLIKTEKFIPPQDRQMYIKNYPDPNKNISQSAKQFILNLLVIDPQQRMTWDQLLKSQYLLENQNQSKEYFPSNWYLPIENLDLSEIKNISAEKQSDKKNESMQAKQVVLQNISERNLAQLQKYYKNQKKYKSQMIKRLKKIHFQLKRIEFLSIVYRKMMQYDFFKTAKLLIKLCKVKYEKLKGEMIVGTLEKNFLHEKFEQFIQNQSEGIEENKQLEGALIKQLVDLQGDILLKINKDEKKDKNTVYFIRNFKKVLEFSSFERKTKKTNWENLEQIVEQNK